MNSENNPEQSQPTNHPAFVRMRSKEGNLSGPVCLRRSPEGKLQFWHPAAVLISTPEDLATAELLARLEGTGEQGT